MKYINKGIELIAVLCMVFAFVSAGDEFLKVLKDTLGYMIYLSVFAAPVVYFSIKRKKALAQRKNMQSIHCKWSSLLFQSMVFQ